MNYKSRYSGRRHRSRSRRPGGDVLRAVGERLGVTSALLSWRLAATPSIGTEPHSPHPRSRRRKPRTRCCSGVGGPKWMPCPAISVPNGPSSA